MEQVGLLDHSNDDVRLVRNQRQRRSQGNSNCSSAQANRPGHRRLECDQQINKARRSETRQDEPEQSKTKQRRTSPSTANDLGSTPHYQYIRSTITSQPITSTNSNYCHRNTSPIQLSDADERISLYRVPLFPAHGRDIVPYQGRFAP